MASRCRVDESEKNSPLAVHEIYLAVLGFCANSCAIRESVKPLSPPYVYRRSTDHFYGFERYLPTHIFAVACKHISAQGARILLYLRAVPCKGE